MCIGPFIYMIYMCAYGISQNFAYSYISSAWLCQQSSWNRYLSVSLCRNIYIGSAWLCQQSPWNQNLSVRVSIISEPNARIAFKFWLLFPLGIMPRQKWKKHFLDFFEYSSFSIKRPYESENSWIFFLLVLSSQNSVWDFWNLKF